MKTTNAARKFHFDDDLIEETSVVCKAMSQPIRLKILGELGVHQKGKCSCIGDLARILGKDQSVIYRHIQILEEAGLITTSKKGSTLFSCTTPKAAEMIRFFRERTSADH